MSQASLLMLIAPTVITGAGILTILICRPLIAGKVGPNPMYGIRTPRAFESEENWYRINRLGGAVLSRWGCFVVVVGLAGFPVCLFGVRGMAAYNLVSLVLILGSLAVVTVRIFQLR